MSTLQAQGGQEGSGCRSVPDGGNSRVLQGRVLAGLRCQLRTEPLPGSFQLRWLLGPSRSCPLPHEVEPGPREDLGTGGCPRGLLPALTGWQVPGWVLPDQWAAHIVRSQVPFEAEESKVRGQSQHPLAHFEWTFLPQGWGEGSLKTSSGATETLGQGPCEGTEVQENSTLSSALRVPESFTETLPDSQLSFLTCKVGAFTPHCVALRRKSGKDMRTPPRTGGEHVRALVCL